MDPAGGHSTKAQQEIEPVTLEVRGLGKLHIRFCKISPTKVISVVTAAPALAVDAPMSETEPVLNVSHNAS